VTQLLMWSTRPAGTGQRQRAALLLMGASGFAGLGYQVVWTQQCALWLGHEAAALLAVVAAFFGGLALGALALGPRIERSLHPVRWYVGCELLIAGWSLALALLLPQAGDGLLDLTGVQPSAVWQWSVAFCGTFLLLLPATAAMGATLPAMERAMAPLKLPGRSIAALYAGNTLGAVIGVLACAFWLVPELGLARTAGLCAALNLLCGGAALWAFALPAGAPAAGPALGAAAGSTTFAAPAVRSARRSALARLAATGLLGIGYEVVVVRVLSQVTEDTVYTFALLLAVYLVGSALGAAAYQRWRHRAAQPTSRSGDQADRLGDALLCGLAAACLLGAASLWGAERVKTVWLAHWGSSLGTALGAEALLALLAFGLPTVVMGALFGHLSSRASAAGVSFGQSLGINTLGAAAAPLLFGVLVAPALGSKWALLLIAAGYLALAGRQAWRRGMGWAAAWVPAAAGLALAAWAPPLAFVEMPEGARLISYQEGVMAAVSVVQDAEGVSRLRINNRQQEGSSSSGRVDGRQALLPLLLHPAPRRALFLGLGTGITSATAAADPTLQVDAVELLPEVIRASAHFTGLSTSNPVGNPVSKPPVPHAQLIAADARRFVRTSKQTYDVIVSDNFHPARSGSGSLYTVQHFQAVRGRLTRTGLFCQWLPLHQMDSGTLRSIVQSFLMVYPGGSALLASNSLLTPVLGLIGHRDAAHTTLAAVRQRLASAAGPRRPADYGIEDEYALLGSFVAGPSALARFAGDAPANTDDRPVVAYRAPRITYAPDSAPGDRLVALLQRLAITSSELVAAEPLDAANNAAALRLDAYWAARNQFIATGLQVRPVASAQGMLAQVRSPLLAVLHTSPDFRPAYDPLLRMADSLTRSDPPAARALLANLAQVQPARPEAPAALRQLDIAAP
jgi:spermidine synthase